MIYLISLLKKQNSEFTGDLENAEQMHITFPLEKTGQVTSVFLL